MSRARLTLRPWFEVDTKLLAEIICVCLDDKALVSIDSEGFFCIPYIKCSGNIVYEYLQISIYLKSHENSMVFLCKYLLGIIQQDKKTLLLFSERAITRCPHFKQLHFLFFSDYL